MRRGRAARGAEGQRAECRKRTLRTVCVVGGEVANRDGVPRGVGRENRSGSAIVAHTVIGVLARVVANIGALSRVGAWSTEGCLRSVVAVAGVQTSDAPVVALVALVHTRGSARVGRAVELLIPWRQWVGRRGRWCGWRRCVWWWRRRDVASHRERDEVVTKLRRAMPSAHTGASVLRGAVVVDRIPAEGRWHGDVRAHLLVKGRGAAFVGGRYVDA